MTKKEEMIKKIFKALAIMKKWDRIQWARKDWVINFEYIDYPKEKECHPIIIDDLLHYKHQMNKDLEMTNSIESLMEKYNILSMQEDWCDKFLNELKSLQSIEQPNVDSIMEDIKLEIGYNKNDHTIDDDYDKWYRAWLMKAKTICKEYKLKHLTSKAPTAKREDCLTREEHRAIYDSFTKDENSTSGFSKKIVSEPQEEVCNNCHWEKQLSELSTTCGRCKWTWFESQEVKVECKHNFTANDWEWNWYCKDCWRDISKEDMIKKYS
jgi:hypothetical protein